MVRLLNEYPHAGAELELLQGTPLQGVRRWIKGNYTFDYESDATGDAVVVLVRHHAQDDPFSPFDPDDADFDG